MSATTSIEWCDGTWSPVVGCARVSAGCDHCYAVTLTWRLEAMGQAKYSGLIILGKKHFNGVARLHAPSLDWPLRWRGSKQAKAEGRPSRIFVNPMSDLFHEALSDEQIAAVYGVMAACPQHTFQVLTKRPERGRRWFEWISDQGEELKGVTGESPPPGVGAPASACVVHVGEKATGGLLDDDGWRQGMHAGWPLPNVWLGVSVEDQATADERIQHLLATPAAVRFVSYEPALGPVDFWRFMPVPLFHCSECGRELRRDCCDRCGTYDNTPSNQIVGLDQIIVGGESGPDRREFRIEWLESVAQQCADAGVALFVKQDAGPRPGMQGRIPDALWARKEFPR